MTKSIRSIGFIGLGDMGGAQVRELAKLALPLTVYDVSPKAMERWAGRATLAADVAAVGAAADAIGICVQDDAQVTTCIDQLLPALSPGTVVMIHSTVRPATVTGLASRGERQGVVVIDAPVTRTEMVDDGPFVYCMVGGDEAVLDHVRPILAAFSTNIMHVGPLGSAMALKICNNLVTWGEIMLALEAVDLAEAAGVPLDKLVTVMARNRVMTPPMNGFIGFRRNPGDQAARDKMRINGTIGEKDLGLAVGLAESVGGTARISAMIAQLVNQTINDVCDS